MQHLGFLNKNIFRKYPFRATSEMLDNAGIAVPLSLFSGLRITTKYEYLNTYISKIVVDRNYISVSVSCLLGADVSTLGTFSGTITEDYQTLPMQAKTEFSSGFLSIGTLSSLALF